MSTTTAQPATTPIPVQLSEPEFTAFILPHLSMPKRGPKCKLGYHRVFNLILWVLYTGMQWQCLPVPHDAQGQPAIHYTTVYRVFAKWAADGSLWQAFIASVRHLAAAKHLDTRRVASALGVSRRGNMRKRHGAARPLRPTTVTPWEGRSRRPEPWRGYPNPQPDRPRRARCVRPRRVCRGKWCHASLESILDTRCSGTGARGHHWDGRWRADCPDRATPDNHNRHTDSSAVRCRSHGDAGASGA
jgi:transposase